MSNPSETPQPSCPVDPAARAAWLQRSQTTQPHPLHPTTPPARPLTKTRPLATDRETSSIPRALPPQPPPPPPPSSSSISALGTADNAHQDAASYPPPSLSSASDASSTSTAQNWIYPSEKQFYAALRRKNHSPSPSTIPAIIPLHNAVNERAWSLILSDWEHHSPSARTANTPCGGPRLRSFSGDSTRLSPRARVYGWLGYERPFDRHDWVVERCGGESVEYVIDFYRGKGGGLSFFLDVRPKLNSWAGWRLRLGRLVGL